jgi:hypothetical protein
MVRATLAARSLTVYSTPESRASRTSKKTETPSRVKIVAMTSALKIVRRQRIGMGYPPFRA